MWGGRGGGVRKSIWGRGGMGWGGAGGGLGVKNKFVLKCFLDGFKYFRNMSFFVLYYTGFSVLCISQLRSKLE